MIPPWQRALSSDPVGHFDGFTARTAGPRDQNPAERTIQTAVWARAAAEILEEVGKEPGGEGVLSTVRVTEGGTVARPLDRSSSPSIGIVDRTRVWVMPSPAGREIATLASEIGRALALGHFKPLVGLESFFLEVPMVVVSDRRALHLARHGHRTLGLQGPWGCLAKASRGSSAPPMELMAGSAAVVPPDLLAQMMVRIGNRVDELLASIPEGTSQWLGRELTRSYVDSWRTPDRGFGSPASRGEREDLLSIPVPCLPSRTSDLAWAVGTALARSLSKASPNSSSAGPAQENPLLLVWDPLGKGVNEGVLTDLRVEEHRQESADSFSKRCQEAAEADLLGTGPTAEALRQPLWTGGTELKRGPQLQGLFRRIRQELGSEAAKLNPLETAVGVALVPWTDDGPSWPIHSGLGPANAPHTAVYLGGLSVVGHKMGTGGRLSLHAGGDLTDKEWLEGLADEIIQLLSEELA